MAASKRDSVASNKATILTLETRVVALEDARDAALGAAGADSPEPSSGQPQVSPGRIVMFHSARAVPDAEPELDVASDTMVTAGEPAEESPMVVFAVGNLESACGVVMSDMGAIPRMDVPHGAPKRMRDYSVWWEWPKRV